MSKGKIFSYHIHLITLDQVGNCTEGCSECIHRSIWWRYNLMKGDFIRGTDRQRTVKGWTGCLFSLCSLPFFLPPDSKFKDGKERPLNAYHKTQLIREASGLYVHRSLPLPSVACFRLKRLVRLIDFSRPSKFIPCDFIVYLYLLIFSRLPMAPLLLISFTSNSIKGKIKWKVNATKK